jgi:hypothetical protein
MRGVIFIIIFLMYSSTTFGQSLSSEFSSMDTYLSLNISANLPLAKESKFSFSNSSRITSDYLLENEIRKLIITNFGYELNKNYTTMVGGVYSNSFGFKPSFGLQYTGKRKRFSWMVFPNLNISSQPDILIPAMIQYSRIIKIYL